MDNNVSMNEPLNILRQNVQGKDFSQMNGKIMNEVSLFQNVNGEEQFNENLTNKDDFISALKVGGNTESVTSEQLGAIYDMLDTDGDGKVSENELKLLASLDGKEKNNKIDSGDIAALAQLAQSGAANNTPLSQNMPEIPVGTTVNSVLKNDERIKQDTNGHKFGSVENWSDSAAANDCLEAIVNNSYDLAAMGIKVGSNEYNSLLNAVMDANPQIYGTAEGGWRDAAGGEGRNNAVLYAGDNIVLPDFQYIKQPETERTSAKDYGTPAVEEGYGNNSSPIEDEGAVEERRYEGDEPYGQYGDDTHEQDDAGYPGKQDESPSWSDFQRINHENPVPFKDRGYNASDKQSATALGHYEKTY